MASGYHIYTIGFTQKTAEEFFGILSDSGVNRLVDTRLNNTSQLARFTKRDDLPFFLSRLCQASYEHLPILAPTQEILDNFKKKKGSWADYEREFLALIKLREIEKEIPKAWFSKKTVLLCSEPTPEHCHRRLVAEYLAESWQDTEVIHL